MKKSRIVLSLILVLLLVFVGSFVLTACGEKDGDNTQSDEQIDTPVTDGNDTLPSNPNEDDNQREELPGNAESNFSLVFELKADDTYEVIGYIGEPINVIIPSTYQEKAVTSIGSSAFYYCFSVTSVVIPDSVISISEDAFYYCISLTSVVIGDRVTSIGKHTFSNCYRLIEVYNLSSLNITKGSEENGYVGYFALDIYTSLDTPSKLSTDNNGYMIYTNGVEKLLVGYVGSEKELTLPSDIPSINQYAFFNCFSPTRIVIGDDVTSIGVGAFGGCHSLTSVVIGDSVTSIGELAFVQCYKLIEVYNLSSLNITKGSEENGYVGCYAKEIYTSLDTPSKLSTDSNGYVKYPNGEEKFLVGYTGSATELNLPNDITSIYQYAFYGCDSLTSVVIPDSVTSIGERAFYSCVSLTNVVIGDRVTSICDGAFYGCGNLTSLIIPDSVTSIGNRAFLDCYKLVEVYNLSSLNITKGSEENGFVENGYVGYYALDIYTSLDTPSKLSTDNNGYMIYTNGEEKVLVGYTGSERELTLPSDITSIHSAFHACDNLRSVVIPDSVISISEYAFSFCAILTSVTIGNNVTSIGDGAFAWCDSLTGVYYIGTIDQWVQIEFSNYSANPLYSAKNLYINNELVTEVNITTATSIKAYAFSSCDSLTSVTIGNSVTSIGYDAFYNCGNLTSVVIPDSVTSIGRSAFNACDSLTSIYYVGTANEWSGISIDKYDNSYLTNATRYYYSETEPVEEGNYWHYVDGVPTPW